MAKREKSNATKDKCRATRLTPRVKRVLLESIDAGLFVEEACVLAGIHKSTYYRWLEQARDGTASDAVCDLCDALRVREIQAEARALAAIRKCATGYDAVTKKVRHEVSGDEQKTVTETITQYTIDWRAAMAWLERRFPARWGRRVDVTDKGQAGGEGGDGMKMLIIDVGREP
jgi:transposase-like protein